jgi:thiopeptide-type bacteriocin biosynthesis protein
MAEVREAVRDTDWVSAHLFCQGSLDDLVVDVVSPVIAALGSGAPLRWFFLRYWDGGPHLRLRVLPLGVAPGEVRALIVEHAERYFRAHQCVEKLRAADYLGMAEKLAAAENMSEYLREPRPNNSVEFLGYRREHERYGTGASVAAVERHFTESSWIALALLRAGMSRGQRVTAACSLLLLTWFCAAPAGGVTRYRQFSAELDAHYRRQRGRLIALAERMRHIAAQESGGAGALSRWVASIVALRDELTELVASGEFAPSARGSHAITAPGDTPRTRVFPVLDLCAHLVCNRLGIGPDEELSLRHLSARAVFEEGP